jgi:hypothetical protein
MNSMYQNQSTPHHMLNREWYPRRIYSGSIEICFGQINEMAFQMFENLIVPILKMLTQVKFSI